MDETKLQERIKFLVDVNGVQEILKALSDEMLIRESIIEDKHNQELGMGFEILFNLVMMLYRDMSKKNQNLIREFMDSYTIKSSLRLIMADHEYSSPATKAAYELYKSFGKETEQP